MKSSNLLLTDDLSIKVCDFGLARRNAEQMTVQVGSFQYMAPEVLLGEQYSFSADVFSYGKRNCQTDQDYS